MVNFSANNQFYLKTQKRTSQDKNGDKKDYWVLTFKDYNTKRVVTYSIWEQKEEPKDENGNELISDVPYVLTGYVNVVGYNNYLNLMRIKIDKKSLKLNSITTKENNTLK